MNMERTGKIVSEYTEKHDFELYRQCKPMDSLICQEIANFAVFQKHL